MIATEVDQAFGVLRTGASAAAATPSTSTEAVGKPTTTKNSKKPTKTVRFTAVKKPVVKKESAAKKAAIRKVTKVACSTTKQKLTEKGDVGLKKTKTATASKKKVYTIFMAIDHISIVIKFRLMQC